MDNKDHHQYHAMKMIRSDVFIRSKFTKDQ